MSTQFTYPQVLGDLLSAALALIAIAALRSGRRSAVAWTWCANIFGIVDLGIVTVQGFRFDFAEHVGGMFYVVVWFVPWLLLSHTLIFARLTDVPLRVGLSPSALVLKPSRRSASRPARS